MNKNFLITLALIANLCLAQTHSNLSVDNMVPQVSFNALPSTTIPSPQTSNSQTTVTTSVIPTIVPPVQPNQASTESHSDKITNTKSVQVEQHTVPSSSAFSSTENRKQQSAGVSESVNQIPTLNEPIRLEARQNGPLEVRFYPLLPQPIISQNTKDRPQQKNLLIESQGHGAKIPIVAKNISSSSKGNQTKSDAKSNITQNGSQPNQEKLDDSLSQEIVRRPIYKNQHQNHYQNYSEQQQFQLSNNNQRNQNYKRRNQDNYGDHLPRRNNRIHHFIEEEDSNDQDRGYSHSKRQYSHRKAASRPRFVDYEDDSHENPNIRRNHLRRRCDSTDQDNYSGRRYSQHNGRRSHQNHRQYEESESEYYVPRISRNQRRHSDYRSNIHSQQWQQERRSIRGRYE